MGIKHTVADSDTYFVVDPATRIVKNASSNKTYLMQYDHNSEELTFEVPRYIETHDMSLCDVIQVHYENKSTGTSVSMRKSYRGIHNIDKTKITVNEDTITFPWLIPENATMFAGSLEFQLKFTCYEDTENSIEGYKWHSYVNSDISIVAGLGATESDMTPSATATLRTLELVELENGVDVILDGVSHPIYHGNSGVYVGSGDMPENCNVQIDPDGEAYSPAMGDIDLTTSIDETSTDDQIPSAKAVYALFDNYSKQVNVLLETLNNGEVVE